MWWFIYSFFLMNKKEKATTNSKKQGDKCFQYAATVTLNYEEIQ